MPFDFIRNWRIYIILQQIEKVKKIEEVLKNKKSANYVKSLSMNTVPKQTYLYQRFMKDENGEQWSPSK